MEEIHPIRMQWQARRFPPQHFGKPSFFPIPFWCNEINGFPFSTLNIMKASILSVYDSAALSTTSLKLLMVMHIPSASECSFICWGYFNADAINTGCGCCSCYCRCATMLMLLRHCGPYNRQSGGGVECSLNSKCSRIQLNVCIHFLLYNDKYINLGNENGVEKTFNETELKPKAESNENISFHFIYIFNAIMSWCWALLLYLFCAYILYLPVNCIAKSQKVELFHNFTIRILLCFILLYILFVHPPTSSSSSPSSSMLYALCSYLCLWFRLRLRLSFDYFMHFQFFISVIGKTLSSVLFDFLAIHFHDDLIFIATLYNSLT